MSKTWVEVLLLAALVTAAWAAFSRGVDAPFRAERPGRMPLPASDDPVGGGLSSRTRALHAYLASPPPPGAVRRNPFDFGERPAPAAPRRSEQVEMPPTAPPRPSLVLSGIAEDAGSRGPVRTAVIKAGGSLVFVKEGDRVLSRFVVERIAADAVQLKDTERGDLFTIALR